MTTVQYVVASAFSLVLFVAVANVLVAAYARAAVRDALDEGVRAAVPAGASADACETRVREVLASVAGGSLVRVERAECVRSSQRVDARADVVVHTWLPGFVPDLRLALDATAGTEQ